MKSVDVLIATPSILQRHNPEDYPRLISVATAGEVCPQGKLLRPRSQDGSIDTEASKKIKSFSDTQLLEIQQRKDPQQYWENIPIELQLPMPSHWDNVQRGILFQAAKAAGFEEIIIRSETLCAAADLCAHHYRALDLSVMLRFRGDAREHDC